MVAIICPFLKITTVALGYASPENWTLVCGRLIPPLLVSGDGDTTAPPTVALTVIVSAEIGIGAIKKLRKKKGKKSDRQKTEDKIIFLIPK